MNTVGLFAGRGDVVLAMAVCLVLGCIGGWHLHRLWVWARSIADGRPN